MPTIIVSGTLHVDPQLREAYLRARVPILEHARQAPGCIDFALSAHRSRRRAPPGQRLRGAVT